MVNVNLQLIHEPKKVRITKFKKEQLASHLENQYPIVLRNKLLSQTLTDDDTKEPPYVPSLKSLQNIKSTINTSKYYYKIVLAA